MPILPIDLQVIMMRMDELTKQQDAQQNGISLAQLVKGSELSEMAHVESSRVNQIKPHPDGNSKIEDKKQKESFSRERKEQKKRETFVEKEKEKILKEFQEPDKGIHIDVKR